MISHGTRWKYAFRAFFSLIVHGRIADDILDAFRPSASRQPEMVPVVPTAEPGDRAVQILSLLQRDGRLIDFLMEDIGGYADAQVGAAVRDVHAACRASLSRYVSLAPVLADPEGAAVTVEAGTDPGCVKLVGHVAGAPPFRGVLRHRGWQAASVDLPPLAASSRNVVAPAEVEVA